jgi:Rrf2 family protein
VFSAKTEYGLISLLELATIYLQGGVLQVAEIASRQNIPDRYLEQMLTSLRRAQILRSIRGPKGGYQLAMAPAQIKVVDVVRCLEGDSSVETRALRDTAEYQVLDGLESELAQARLQILEGTTLQDLVDRRDRLVQSQAMYFI